MRRALRVLRTGQPDDRRQDDAVRRVVDARRVFRVEIVVVLRQRGPPSVGVALAELVVLRMAPGVAVAYAQPAVASAHPLVELQ